MSKELQPFNGDDESSVEEELLAAFDEIPFGNSLYQIQHVVLSHATPERQYRQALLEIKEKWIALKKAQYKMRKLDLEKDEAKAKVKDDDAKSRLEFEEKEFDWRMARSLVKDAIVELNAYYAVFKKLKEQFGGNLTRDDFEKSEEVYWPQRAIAQSKRDVIATGTIGQGNVEFLEQVGLDPTETRFQLLEEHNAKIGALKAGEPQFIEEKALPEQTTDGPTFAD